MRLNIMDKKFTKSKNIFLLPYLRLTYKFILFIIRPLNQSENLAQLISKIDFTGEIFDGDKDRDEKIDASQAPKDLDKGETISARKFYQNIYEKIK
jgi:hypothetical protein